MNQFNRDPQVSNRMSHRLSWIDTDNRHIIPVKSQGFYQPPQEIMEKYNGCSVPQYTAYRRVRCLRKGVVRAK
jgi:hypothetical protein